tara:strand:+ start:815 stop:1228 length:414 start_codon:yes stop_codon:yes gene_type:complete
MSKFFKEVTVSNDHLDDLNHVNNVQYLYWSQEIAKDHWNYLTKDLNNEFGIWVVRHHDVSYRLAGFFGDTIKVSTYITDIRGPISERIIEFHNKKTNKLLVKICTKWCYINNINERKLSLIPDQIIKLFDPINLKIK